MKNFSEISRILTSVAILILILFFFTFNGGNIIYTFNTKITDFKNSALTVFSSEYKTVSAELTIENDDFSDIFTLENQYKILYDKGKYKPTGEIKELNMAQYKATDNYDGVYIQNNTDTKKINIKDILSKGSGLKIKKSTSPVVLIYHTHTSECYKILDNGAYSDEWDSHNTDINLTVARVGDELAKSLENHGFTVIHDKTIYDGTYSESYGRSRKAVTEYLEKYPDLLVTIDIHRDAVYTDNGVRYKCVTDIEGNKTSQIMIITGAEEDYITDFPDWKTNLAFALQIQKKCSLMYPELMRPIFFTKRVYNMDLTPYSLLFEVGTDVNTLEESVRAAAYMGNVLSSVLEDCLIE